MSAAIESLDLTNAVATIASAFIGSLSAFLLATKREERELKKRRAEAGNRALFALGRQLNTLETIKRQFVDPVRQDPARFLSMRAFMATDQHPHQVDLSSLEYLLETEDREVLFTVLLEQERFETATLALKYRSQLHMDEVQPKLAANGIQSGGLYSLQQIQAALGARLYAMIVEATDIAIKNVDDYIASNIKCSEDLRNALKRVFPQRKFIQFNVDR